MNFRRRVNLISHQVRDLLLYSGLVYVVFGEVRFVEFVRLGYIHYEKNSNHYLSISLDRVFQIQLQKHTEKLFKY
jgi:hypothetical protein